MPDIRPGRTRSGLEALSAPRWNVHEPHEPHEQATAPSAVEGSRTRSWGSCCSWTIRSARGRRGAGKRAPCPRRHPLRRARFRAIRTADPAANWHAN